MGPKVSAETCSGANAPSAKSVKIEKAPMPRTVAARKFAKTRRHASTARTPLSAP